MLAIAQQNMLAGAGTTETTPSVWGESSPAVVSGIGSSDLAGQFPDTYRRYEVFTLVQTIHCSWTEGTDPQSFDPYPSLLFDLEYGVDYAEIPGTEDRWVQYADGTVTFLGWGTEPGDLFTIFTVPTADGNVTTRLQFTEGLITPGDFDVSAPDVEVTGAPGETLTATAAVPAVPELTIHAAQQHYFGGASYGSLVAQVAPTNRMRPLVVTPAFRYWIPRGGLPLRVRQRNDGLSRSAGRSRQGMSSRQMSVRARGYV